MNKEIFNLSLICVSIWLFIFNNEYCQSIFTSTISEMSGIQTDRRPISVGLYDSTVNKTFLCWMGSYSNPIVKEFDHSLQKWSPDKTIGTSPFADSHNYPGMIQSANGKLLVFYGCHNSILKISSSPEPGSIQGKWIDREISEAQGASYSVPIITENGTIYCFYRVTMQNVFPQNSLPGDYRPMAYIKSTDNGETWSTTKIFIDNYPRADHLCEIYTGKISYQPKSDSISERIHIAWTISGGGPDSHQHALYRRNVYYTYLNLSDEHFFTVENVDLGTEINNEESENYCKAIDTGIPPEGIQLGYQTSVHFGDNGKPIIMYRGEGFESLYYNGGQWKRSNIYASANEPRDIEKIGPSEFRTYRTSGKSVYIFKTTNAGINWEQENKFTLDKQVRRCYVIDNYNDQIKYLITENKSDGNVEEANLDIFVGGLEKISSLHNENEITLKDFILYQNYPNPFNPETTISYGLKKENFIKISVFNSIGQEIENLYMGFRNAGTYNLKFKGENYSSGIYYLKLETKNNSLVKKMMLIK